MRRVSRVIFLALISTFFLPACVNDAPSEPVARDTSKDDPKKVAEIARLTAPKKGPVRTYQAKQAFGSSYRPGWTTYKIDEAGTQTTSVLQIQLAYAPGQKGRIWLEVRNLGPDHAVVTRMLLNTAKDQMIAVNDSPVRINKLERLIVWDESEATAKEWSDEQIKATNDMARALGSTMIPKQPLVGAKTRQAKTLAGIFPHCRVEDQEKVWILVDEEHTCYSSAVPLPYIVEVESEKRHQQLVDFGFGAKPSLVPKHIKVVKGSS